MPAVTVEGLVIGTLPQFERSDLKEEKKHE